MSNSEKKVTLERLSFKNGKTVQHGDLIIPIPDGYRYTTDSSVMYPGKSYPLLIVPDTYAFDDNPDDAPFSIAFEPNMKLSNEGITISRERKEGIERFLCAQWGNVFHSDVTWIDAGVRDGFGAFYQLFGDESVPSHRFMLCMITTKHQMGAVHVHCNKENADLWNDPYAFIDKCNSFLERIRFVGENVLPLVSTTPLDDFCPHYLRLKKMSGPIAPGVFSVVNSAGTEYEFIPLSELSDRYEVADEEKAVYQRVIDKDTGTNDLNEKASEMQQLFHVNASAFDQKRDRECEIEQGLLHRAYMMSALRSFAWTLADYCETNSLKPDAVTVKKLKEIVAFCADEEWLNYRGRSHCSGLCDCADLHVFYIPDGVSKADRKKLLPSDELIRETEERRAALPYYNPMLDEVNSLDSLRKDLSYIYPAVKALWDELAATRDYDKALTGNEADIVYAWCSLAKAAKEPFYVEDGPSYCCFTQMKTEEESAADREAQRIRWEAEREENAERNKEEWLNNYGHAIEKNPDIQFDGKLFVFSGVDSDEVIDAVLKRGGQQRSKISGITNYLVVDPRYCGESKTYNAIEQQKKGKPVKIILLEDLRAALEGKASNAKRSPSSSSSSAKTTKTESIPSTPKKATPQPKAASSSKTSSGGFPKGKQIKEGDDLIIKAGVLKEYNGSEKDIILPTGIKTIGEDVFQFSSLRSIVIPEGVTKIEKDAFYSCKELTHVQLPASLWKIGEQAFYGCKRLEYIELPEQLSALGESAFYKSGLKEVRIPHACTCIPESAFQECSELSSVITHEGVTEIGGFAFRDCPKLKEIYVPENATVGVLAFDDSTRIQCTRPPVNRASIVDRKPTVRSLPADFPRGKRLYEGDDLVIENRVVKEYWGSETDIILPEGIRAIGEEIFQFSSLRSIVIPEGVTEIRKDAFYSCKELTHVFLPDSLRKIGEWAFHNCGSLKKIDIPDGVSQIDEYAFNEAGIREVRIPETCHVIAEGVFSACRNLGVVSIHDSVEEIGNSAFGDCSKLREVFVPKNANVSATAFDDSTRVRRSKDAATQEKAAADAVPPGFPKGTLIDVDDGLEIENHIVTGYYPTFTGEEDIILPSGIVEIGNYGFLNSTFRSVVIPEGVTKIGENAFQGCTALTNIHLPSTLKEIGEDAFRQCIKLESLIIPDGVTIISKDAFSESGIKHYNIPKSIKSLFGFSISPKGVLTKYEGSSEKIVIPDIVTKIGVDAFSYNYSLESVVIPEGVTAIGASAFSSTGLKRISFPSTLLTIGEKAFQDCKLERISFPESVNSIAKYMFWGCKNLKEIILPASLQSIGEYAFWSCDELCEVTFQGNECTEIGGSAFQGCKSLTKLDLPEGITKIGYAAFNESGLVSVSLPASLKTVNDRMFDGCEHLKEVEFRGKIDKIGYRMFGKCKALETLIIPEGTKSIAKEALCESKQLKDVFIPASVKTVALGNNDAGKRTVFHVVPGSVAEQFCKNNNRKYDNLTIEEALEKRRTENGYADAKALMEKGEYAAASKLFASVASYKDAEKQAKICEQKDLEQRTERTYTEAKNLMERGEFAAAKEKFMAVSGHQDADLLAKDCEEKEQLRRSELAYRQLLEKKARAKTVDDWTSLANLFMQMNDYKDTQAQAQYCSEQAAEVQRLIEEERRKELERRAIEERRRQLENEKKEQEAIIEQNRGLGALFGEKAKKRKAAQARIEEINKELEKL